MRILVAIIPFWLFLQGPEVYCMDPVDTDQPVYQARSLVPDWVLKTHPALKEVQIDTRTYAEKLAEAKSQFEWELQKEDARNRKKTARLGWWAAGGGLLAILVGMTLSVFLKQYGCQLIGTVMAVLGVPVSAWGLIALEWAKHWDMVPVVGIAIILVVLVTYLAKKFDLLDWFRNRQKAQTEEPLTVEDIEELQDANL